MWFRVTLDGSENMDGCEFQSWSEGPVHGAMNE